MSRFDDDEDGPENFRPVPHPDDRLWRHPSEIAAMHAAANAAADQTVELPVANPAPVATGAGQRTGPLRVHWGLLAAAVTVAVGASALSAGVLTARSGDETATQPDQVAVFDDQSTATSSTTRSIANQAPAAVANPAPIARISAEDAALASRLHAELAHALPRIQAASPHGMNEGSGLFISDDGLLVTSAALVRHADYLLAWTEDGRRLHADLVALDEFSDVAILQVDTTESHPVAFRIDAEPRSGQYALAIDYADRSMTLGEVSSISASAPALRPGDRSSRLSIAPGALPGSAVVDDTGHVIAMANLAGDDPSGPLIATPGWMIQRVVNDLLRDGAATHTWLGVQIQAESNGAAGPVIEVVDHSPAARAGLRSGDIIDSIDGTPITSSMSLWTLVQMRSPGDEIALGVTRNGERRLVWATLDALNE